MSIGDYYFKRRSAAFLAGALDSAGYAGKRILGIRAPELPDPGRSLRVLLIRLDHLGDGIFLMPALRAARQLFPRAHLTLLAGPWAEDLVEPGLWVDEVKVYRAPWFDRQDPRKFGWKGFRDILGWIRGRRFDVGIDFRGDARHLLWMALGGIPVRVGYGPTGGGFLLTHEGRVDRTRHEVESNLELLRFFDPRLRTEPMSLPNAGSTAAIRAGNLLRETGVDLGRPLIVVQVTAGYPSKEWGDEKYGRLLAGLLGKGIAEIVLIGAPEDRQRVGEIARGTGDKARNLCGKTGFGDLRGLLERASVFVGPDSGPGHLAALLGRPCVFIYSGVNDLRRWGPWTLGREEKTRLFTHAVPCSPCGLPLCPINHECLGPIGAEEVQRAVQELLGRP